MRGLTHSDIVNDNAKTVWVRVEGVVNQQPFAVERSASRCAALLGAKFIGLPPAQSMPTEDLKCVASWDAMTSMRERDEAVT